MKKTQKQIIKPDKRKTRKNGKTENLTEKNFHLKMFLNRLNERIEKLTV